MKKIAVFGKPGSGKSTLSKSLSFRTEIPLYPLDSIVYKKNGELVDRASFDEAHENILSSNCWIIDGLGPMGSFNKRLDAADTLIYIDLPYAVSYWLVTKRLLKGIFVKPEGWPKGSSIIKGSMQSYKMLKLSPTFWNNDFLEKLAVVSADKNLQVIRSTAELTHYRNSLEMNKIDDKNKKE